MSMEHTPFPGEYLYNDTMRRLAKIEDVATSFATHTAVEELKFAEISRQITELGETLGGAIEGLAGRVETLAVKSEEHTQQLASIVLTHDTQKKTINKRKRWFYKILGVGGIAVGAFIARFGEVVWDWWFKR